MFTTITQVLRSSETAREKSWQWLMGLFESQGCLSVARKSHNTEGLSLSISRPLKNTQVLYYIKGLLGSGHVKLLTMAKYYVANKELLMNILPLKCLNNEARLAGLVDGEGVFIVSLKHSPNTPSKKTVGFSLVISQVEEVVLGPFLEKLGGDLRKNEKEGTFRWEIREKGDLIRAMRLFKKYSLQTKKRIDFLKWCKVLELTNHKSGLRYSPNHGESFGRETL
nr:homing endonuclease [Paraphelliactis xishaensis]